VNKAVFGAEPAELQDVPTSAIAENLIYRQKTIYGFYDRRKDFFEIQDSEILKVADSVASLVPSNRIQIVGNSATMSGQTLGDRFSLCRDESYYDEPSLADCTAFVVPSASSDLVATAGHCVPLAGSARVVFGFRELKDSSGIHAQVVIPNSQVYRVAQVIAQKAEPSGSDFAILRLDRPIKDHAPLTLDSDGKPEKGSFVYTLGHPSGLPIKLADNATIQSVSDSGYFTANLDTFGGNSGSPVFSTATNHVQGILVRGGTDYKRVGTCNRAFVCPAMPDSTVQCGGEAVTLISELSGPLSSVAAGKAVTAEKVISVGPPILKTFSSGLVVSGSGKNFSPEYQVVSDPAPAGYKIGGFTYSLSGDRGCNAWSTCKAAIEGNRVIFRFSLQGHNEWPPPGQATSQGYLVVKYITTN